MTNFLKLLKFVGYLVLTFSLGCQTPSASLKETNANTTTSSLSTQNASLLGRWDRQSKTMSGEISIDFDEDGNYLIKSNGTTVVAAGKYKIRSRAFTCYDISGAMSCSNSLVGNIEIAFSSDGNTLTTNVIRDDCSARYNVFNEGIWSRVGAKRLPVLPSEPALAQSTNKNWSAKGDDVKSAKQAPPFLKDSLDTYIQREMAAWQIPGLAVAIVKDGKVVLARGYGVREIGHNEKVDENTLFMIASNTKAFTATSLALLEGEKKLSLDDKVSRWLPYFKMTDTAANRDIRIKDLLSHRVGMETFQGDFTYWGSNLTRKQIVMDLGKMKPTYLFRDKWGYCNSAFVAAGEVLEAASGMKWETFVKERFLKPLKMDRTLMSSAEMPLETNIAFPHSIFPIDEKLTKIPFAAIDNIGAAASMVSSVKDMSNWLIMQLDSGRFENKQIIPFSVIQKTRTPLSIAGGTRYGANHFSLYGMGWFLSDYNGKLVVNHTGGADGFVTSVRMLPEENLGIVVLTNTDQNRLFENLSKQIVDTYLGLPYKNISKNSFEMAKKDNAEKHKEYQGWVDKIAQRNTPMFGFRDYVGTYEHPLYGKILIKQLENNQLQIQFLGHANLVADLSFMEDNTFLATYSYKILGTKPAKFKAENGKIKTLSIEVDDFVEFLPYDFTKID